jgi:hypothetical protein
MRHLQPSEVIHPMPARIFARNHSLGKALCEAVGKSTHINVWVDLGGGDDEPKREQAPFEGPGARMTNTSFRPLLTQG